MSARPSVGAMANAHDRQIFACISFCEADFREDDTANERVESGVGQVAADALETRDDVRHDGLIDPDLAGYMRKVDFGHSRTLWCWTINDAMEDTLVSVTYISGCPMRVASLRINALPFARVASYRTKADI